MYLAYDPGKTTGWAMFDDAGESVQYGQLSLDELVTHVDSMTTRSLTEDPLVAIIVEEFKLFGHKAKHQVGSQMEASQAIGILRVLANNTGAEFVLQPPTIKAMAVKWTQLSPKGLAHAKTHWIDAFNHGAYYLIKRGIRKTELERSSGRSDG